MEKNRIRVLVAEDDYLVSQEVIQAVQNLGYEVVGEADNGEEAVEAACRLKPDVILMDIQMPGINGLEASEIIQDKCPTPVVVLTAHQSNEFVGQAGETGVGAYLTKPPNSREIERAVVIAMARHGDLMTYRKMARELAEKNAALEKAMEEIKTLRGCLPICANCKKIRDDKGYWERIEDYLRRNSDLDFTHGICPDCVRELYPDVADRILEKSES